MTEGLTTPQSANADSSPLGKGSLLESGTTVGSCTVQKPPLCKGRWRGVAATEGLTTPQSANADSVPQFAMVALLRLAACSTPLLIGLTTACFAPQFTMVALLRLTACNAPLFIGLSLRLFRALRAAKLRPTGGGPFRHAGLFSCSNNFSRVMFFSHVPLR